MQRSVKREQNEFVYRLLVGKNFHKFLHLLLWSAEFFIVIAKHASAPTTQRTFAYVW